MVRFISKFPFISFSRKIKANDYSTTVILHEIDDKNKQQLIKICKEMLIENRILLNKIHFVFNTSFIYDIDKNIVNPTYKTILPKNKKHPIIEINKPNNVMTIFLGEYRTYNNYKLLKQITKKSKRGVVILANIDFDEVMWLANLDDAYDYYWSIHDVN